MYTKIVYVLVSDKEDYYYEQFLISLRSLHLFNASVDVVLVCDKDTRDGLVGFRSGYEKSVSDVIVVEVPNDFNKAQKSRYIKTNLRQFVKGNYLFIDTDTIICASLDSIDEINAEISAVAEFNESFVINEWLKKDIEKSDLTLIGWENILNKFYCNSGVMFVKDSELTHEFYRKWYNNWLTGASFGLMKDQPALGLTNEQFGNIIKELPGIWNCQVLQKNRDKYIDNAKIIHYFASVDELLNVFCIENELLKIKFTGEISDSFEQKLLNPQNEIFDKRALIKGRQLDFVNSDMYEIFDCFPKVFKNILLLAKAYVRIKRCVWDLLHNTKT